MPVYTVHLPGRFIASELTDQATAGPAGQPVRPLTPDQAGLLKAAFVPEGFSLTAFLFGPFWLAWHRLWLELLAWLVVFALLASGTPRFIGSGMSFLIGVLLQVLLALEANNLRRGGLARRGYRFIDVAAGARRDDAERGFFQRWIEGRARVPAQAAPADQVSPPPPDPQSEILGVFPLPENPR